MDGDPSILRGRGREGTRCCTGGQHHSAARLSNWRMEMPVGLEGGSGEAPARNMRVSPSRKAQALPQQFQVDQSSWKFLVEENLEKKSFL